MLLHLDLRPRESYDSWLSLLQDLVARGVRNLLLVVMDAAPGLMKAVKRVWPRAYRQRCLAHKMRNRCTRTHADVFRSYRATGAKTGRSQASYEHERRLRPSSRG